MENLYALSLHPENHAALCTPDVFAAAVKSPLGLGLMYNLSATHNVYTPEVAQMALDVINANVARPEVRFVAFTPCSALRSSSW